MDVVIKPDYAAMSETAAGLVIDQLRAKPDSLFCFPSGDSPTGMLKILVDKGRNGEIDFSQSKFVGLDEWVGMDKQTTGSCQHYMYKHFFDAVPIAAEQITFFDARSSNLISECKRVDDFIFSQGGIDLLIVGVGLNGHIGLNEPGSSFDNFCHVPPLDAITIQVAQKYFAANTKLVHGITLGIKHMLQTRTSIIIASGERKSKIMKEIIEGPISEAVPGTALRTHKNAFCILDEAAASKLKK